MPQPSVSREQPCGSPTVAQNIEPPPRPQLNRDRPPLKQAATELACNARESRESSRAVARANALAVRLAPKRLFHGGDGEVGPSLPPDDQPPEPAPEEAAVVSVSSPTDREQGP